MKRKEDKKIGKHDISNVNKDEISVNIKKEKKEEKFNKSKNKVAKNKVNNKNEKNNGKKKHKVLKIVLAILLVIVLIASAIFARYMYKSGGNIKSAIMNMVQDIIGEKDPIFVLVMGVSEDISAELTDTIMLVGYNPDTNQAFVLSIPRDTFIGTNENIAGGFDKINALYQKSPEKTVEAVENLTGINIDYYVTVKTSALVEIVDAIGGVEFDVPINMDYDDSSQDLHIHLTAGEQLLNGDQAEQLVRFRHNNNGTTYSADYGDNDEGRMRTQREFLKVVAQQVISWNNVDKIKEIATAVFNNLETNMELSDMLGYIPYVAEFNIENLNMEQLPGASKKINELWFYSCDKSETKTLINSYLDQLGLTDAQREKCVKQQVETTTETKTKTTNTTQKNTENNVNKNTNTTNENNTTNTMQNNTTNTTNNTNNTTNNTKNNVDENNNTNITNNTTTNTTNTNTTKNEINENNTVTNKTEKNETNVITKNEITEENIE